VALVMEGSADSTIQGIGSVSCPRVWPRGVRRVSRQSDTLARRHGASPPDNRIGARSLMLGTRRVGLGPVPSPLAPPSVHVMQGAESSGPP
jgi:hypothetical protein